MSFDPSEYRDSMVHCDCGASHPPAYQLSACNHRGCDTRGCHECLRPCSNADSCGRFCEFHLVNTELDTDEALCFHCIQTDFDADELIEAKDKERVAA